MNILINICILPKKSVFEFETHIFDSRTQEWNQWNKKVSLKI